jgi:hypothetical protein
MLGSANTGQERAEMVQDKLLRDVTHEYFEFIKTLLRSPGATKLLTKLPPSILFHFINSKPEAMHALLYTLASSFSWPDSVTTSNTFLICSHIIPLVGGMYKQPHMRTLVRKLTNQPWFADDARYYSIVGGELFTAVINALSASDDRTFSDLLTIVQAIYSLPNKDLQRNVLASQPDTSVQMILV